MLSHVITVKQCYNMFVIPFSLYDQGNFFLYLVVLIGNISIMHNCYLKFEKNQRPPPDSMNLCLFKNDIELLFVSNKF